MSEKKLPQKGMPREQIVSLMNESRKIDADWKNARTWSLVYYAGEDILEVAKTAYNAFFSENALNPMAFQSLKKFENEAVAMTAGMLGGDKDTEGTLSSGGTESILLAVKTARDWARDKKPEIKEPEMVLPLTAHPAFEKAGHYFNVKPVHIPIDSQMRAQVDAAQKAVTKNTVLMVGSAACYPYGVIDPIEPMAKIARENNILFHTDSCLGGFMLPFLKKLGHKIPPFDLSVTGVTSISADIHKYGYAAKGASAVIYKNSELRKYQFYVYADWPGGVYPSPSMTGTRPGGAIAAAWAVMNYLGEEGYLRLADETMKVTQKLMEGINAIPGLKVMVKPDMSVFAFTSDRVNVYELGDLMESKGWNLDRLQMPPALHMIVTPNHKKIIEPFIADLEASVKQLLGKGKGDASGMAAVYGMIGTLPDRKAAKQLVLNFMDDLFKVK
jgi:glutamate/tyrosine decarboxylase-like PLP-dependent enzyme